MPTWPFSSPSSTKLGGAHAVRTPSTTHQHSEVSRQYSNGGNRSQSTFHELCPPTSVSADSISRSSGHSRTSSATLPTLFGTKKFATAEQDSFAMPSPSYLLESQPSTLSPRRRANESRTDDGAFETGHCATCSSKARWPADVVEYRCGICLMINSIRPSQRSSPGPAAFGQHIESVRTYQGSAAHAKGMPLSLDRTRAIIDHCIHDFLEDYLQTAVSPDIPLTSSVGSARDHASSSQPELRLRPTEAEAEASPEPQIALTDMPGASSKRRAPCKDRKGPTSMRTVSFPALRPQAPLKTTPSGTRFSGSPQLSPASDSRSTDPPPPTRKPPTIPAFPSPPNQHSIQRKAVPQSPRSPSESRPSLPNIAPLQDSQTKSSLRNRSIFEPLEDYILHSFGQHTSLNSSFSSLRPRARKISKSDDSLRGRHTSPTMDFVDSQLSEIDAKTLLLGDVAENGLWWTGRDGPSNLVERSDVVEESVEVLPDLVHSRSPHISWMGVNEWYRTVICTGEDWRARLKTTSNAGLTGEAKKRLLNHSPELDAAFRIARLHVQKTLLKISETLLKRPGCVIKSPGDIRFIIILLANPLLYPPSSSALLLKVASELGTTDIASTTSANPDTSLRPNRKSALTSYWGRGDAFGIIKRILGLLSTLSNECHRYLTSWFARYREDRFRQLLQLIDSFVTYRLGRQESRGSAESEGPVSLVPSLSGTGSETSAQLHAALGLGSSSKPPGESTRRAPRYSDDWQVRAAARVMALLFVANKNFQGERARTTMDSSASPDSGSRNNTNAHGQLVSTSQFYNLKLDYCDLIGDFEIWENSKAKFSFCQYPFFFSVGSKIRIMEHDARRQMEVKAREAFFESILRNRDLQQYLHLKVRRDCLVEDSLTAISQVVGQGQQEIKKGLRVQFVGEEGIDAGGLRKEWFLLLVREIFEPNYGLFTYDNESNLCYFNPYAFEASEQYFLVGALLGLAIYNSTILDVALPPFLFKKLLASGSAAGHQNAFNRTPIQYSLEDLFEYQPSLAKGLRQLLEFDGDVQATYCRDFVAEVNRYGSIELVPLCTNGRDRPVNNSNRQEFVDLYVRFLLDTQVARQFEPFKRGFFTVCGGNALSLFQPEEIELLVRGSDERLDVASLKAVAVYDNWQQYGPNVQKPAEEINLIRWFWGFLESADPKTQRKALGFITGSDRIPALGATSLVIKLTYAGSDSSRFPIARTCFNSLLLYKYRTEEELVGKLRRAISESEGFGLK